MGTRRVVATERVPRLGHYSQAVRVDKTIYVSGQRGVNPKTGKPVDDSFDSQARQAFKNLQWVLEDAGASLDSVVKIVCYMTDESDYAKLDALFTEFFRDSPPVRSSPIVGLRKGYRVVIDAIAVAD